MISNVSRRSAKQIVGTRSGVSITSMPQHLPVITARSLTTTSARLFIYKDKNTTIEQPKYEKGKGGNFIMNAINYANKVDETVRQIDAIPSSQKTSLLLERIKVKPELLFHLALFHSELEKIGINRTNTVKERANLSFRYRIKYLTSLRQIHTIFFDSCKLLGITQLDHKLGFSPNNIGILDPKNFSPEEYAELQTGTFQGVEFGNIIMCGASPFTKR